MMKQPNEIDQLMLEIDNTLKQIPQNLDMKTLEQQISQLKQLVENQATEFSATFYDTIADIAEKITQFRQNRQLRNTLLQRGIFQILDQLIELFRSIFDRHKHISFLQNTKALDFTHSNAEQIITVLQNKIETAEKIATDASAAANKANKNAQILLKKLQNIQPDKLDEALLKESEQLSLAMFIHNAAAAITADDFAGAIMELEEYLEKLD